MTPMKKEKPPDSPPPKKNMRKDTPISPRMKKRIDEQ